jgi:hypothetical protein
VAPARAGARIGGPSTSYKEQIMEAEHQHGHCGDHIHQLEAKITELSDALAHLGRGTSMAELLRIIRFPGWTTPAEIGFLSAALEQMMVQVAAIERFQGAVLDASRQVSHG